MKIAIVLTVVIASTLKGQVLEFNKPFVQCEDKWVAFQPADNGDYTFGFIYIDAEAGLTFNREGKFKIQGQEFVRERSKVDSVSLKARLEPNQVLVALIPKSRFAELGIDVVPDWLKFYKKDTASVERKFRWGFLYNSWNECAKALAYLGAAQKIKPNYKGLAFELGYSYNCLQEFDKAIAILSQAIEASPKDCYLYKELSFAEMHLGQLDKASDTCEKGISKCSDKAIKAEIAYNLTYFYYKNGDKENFKKWFDKTKKWTEKGDVFMTNLEKMKDDIGK